MPGQSSGRRSDIVYDALLSEIGSGALKRGEKLPTETSIAEQYGVSRPIVREALARLREDGVVRSQQGSGSYVESNPAARVSAIAPLASIADVQRCFEFRICLEPNAARFAAERRTVENLDELRRAYLALDEIIQQKETGTDQDFLFHHAVAQASHNRFLTASLEQIRSHIAQGISINRTLSLASERPRILTVQAEHSAIVDAIAAGTPEAAAKAMETHLRNAKARVFED